ncbi:phospholipase D-like domain-containing protein [Streptacidiphilus sp. PAMC 29251]
MKPQDWLLAVGERGNPATALDRRRADGLAWSTGNDVTPLVHGEAYFAELLAAIRAQQTGDLLLFTDWRGDPDEELDGPGSAIGEVLCDAARRGVIVKGLVWRSHLDQLQFSERENRHLGEEIEAAGGECLLDMRVRPGGSHHQKFVVLRHPGRPERDVAFVGGIDLCHSRRDTADHHGDPNPLPLSAPYGPRPRGTTSS